MTDSSTTKQPASPETTLSQLRINHEQRPVPGHRGWLPLVLLTLLVIVIVAAGGWWYMTTTGTQIASALREPIRDVRLLTVTAPQVDGAAPVILMATGRIVSDHRVNVATKVSGQIVDLTVEQGDYVELDQVLARIEDVVYRAQRDQASASVAGQRLAHARAKAEATRARAAIDQARANHEFELRNFERLVRLQRGGQASEQEMLDARNRHEAARAALAVAQAASAAAEISIQSALADLAAVQANERLLQKRLDDCEIRAPIHGVVLERNAQVGDFLAAEGGRGANANAQLVAIADMTLLRVEIDVSERDIHRVQAGQPTRITPDASRADTYDGRVMWIDPVGDYARAMVQVKVRILEPGPGLRIGGSAKVAFLADKGDDSGDKPASLWLPKSAVRILPGDAGAVVLTVADERAVANPVTLGATGGDTFEVLSGIRPGMEIIADNVEAIEPGARVRVPAR